MNHTPDSYKVYHTCSTYPFNYCSLCSWGQYDRRVPQDKGKFALAGGTEGNEGLGDSSSQHQKMDIT